MLTYESNIIEKRGITLDYGGETLYIDHNKPAFIFDNKYDMSEFKIKNLNIIKKGKREGTAFQWRFSNLKFSRNFTFENVKIQGFDKAFALEPEKGDIRTHPVGFIRVRDSEVSYNNWAFRCEENSQIHGLVFDDNIARHQKKGGLNLQVINGRITGNDLEGQPNPLRLFHQSYHVVVENNWCEKNRGDYVIELDKCFWCRVGHNRVTRPTAKKGIIIKNSRECFVIGKAEIDKSCKKMIHIGEDWIQ